MSVEIAKNKLKERNKMFCVFCGKKIEGLKWEIGHNFRVAVSEYECDCGKFIRFIDTKSTELYATVTID
ncbi:hypothetical protein [Thermodesulfovibrio yellowstonii]|uniref:hypothetical protein n=1 Tax=Thermodesulfovibrio yellowstonii TaxID=28262 RepID=UPI000426CC54|nr:hypothetical protein [Thermodesulfovibrio islandicus]